MAAEPLVDGVERRGVEVGHRADRVVMIGMVRGEQRFELAILDHGIRLVVALALLILDDAALGIERLLRHRAEQVPHTVAFHEQGGLQRGARHGLVIIGPVEPGAAVDLGRADPLQRRGYALWLCRDGAAHGIDRQSIAAAAAILRQGTSLLRPPPRWPAQAVQQIMPADRDLETWLAEPIVWDLGAPPDGIPMPRALALLWELRQDVRLHFPNRTRAEVLDYLGWCLTRGLRDGCVAVELIEPGLAETLATQTEQAARQQEQMGHTPVLLVPGPLRASLSRFLRRALPQLKVLSHAELPDSKTIRVTSLVGGQA